MYSRNEDEADRRYEKRMEYFSEEYYIFGTTRTGEKFEWGSRPSEIKGLGGVIECTNT